MLAGVGPSGRSDLERTQKQDELTGNRTMIRIQPRSGALPPANAHIRPMFARSQFTLPLALPCLSAAAPRNVARRLRNRCQSRLCRDTRRQCDHLRLRPAGRRRQNRFRRRQKPRRRLELLVSRVRGQARIVRCRRRACLARLRGGRLQARGYGPGHKVVDQLVQAGLSAQMLRSRA